MNYDNLSDEQRIELLQTEQNDRQRAFIIRSFSSDELKLQYIHLVIEDENKSSVTYHMTNEENKVKIIETMQDERWIAASTMELSSNENKMRLLSKIDSVYYKNFVINKITENDEEILAALDYVKNERDKAIIIAKLTDDKLKLKCLDEIEDDVNKSRIITTVDNDDLKLEYIEKVDSSAAKTLLIGSLKNQQLRDEFLKNSNNKYSKINVPDGMTIGVEIECEGENSMEAYLIDDIFKGWNAKDDTSLERGIEITSPVLTNSKEDAYNLYLVCNVLQDLRQTVSDRCGGHIHIGADYLKTKEAYANLIELWSNNEELMFLLSNKAGEISREGTIEYATPISLRIGKAIDARKFEDYDDLDKKGFIKKVKDVQEHDRGKEGTRTDINFINVESEERDINTIEFRLSNGTIDANTWIENANLFCGLVAISQEISDIQHKNIYEIDEKDRGILEKFTKLKNINLSNEERLEMLLDLCVPEEMRQIYIDRYTENSRLLEENKKVKEGLNAHISDKPIEFDISGVRNIAEGFRYSEVKKAEAELVQNFLEYENPTQTREDSVSLYD